MTTLFLFLFIPGQPVVTNRIDGFPNHASCVKVQDEWKYAGNGFARDAFCVTVPKLKYELPDPDFERMADEAVKETDADMCRKATEAWQRKAFCKESK